MIRSFSILESPAPVIICGITYDVPVNVYRDPDGCLTMEPNGDVMIAVIPGAQLLLDGVAITLPTILYRSPSGGVRVEPNGPPFAEIGGGSQPVGRIYTDEYTEEYK